MTGELVNGATAFYFKDVTPTVGPGNTTEAKLNEMFFNSTTNKKITLSLDDKSTLFVIDNTAKNATPILLSSVDPSQINNFLGSFVSIDPASTAFKAYKTSKGVLSINTDVNLNNTATHNLDKYYRGIL